MTSPQDATWACTAFAGCSRILGASDGGTLVRRPFGDVDQFQVGLRFERAFAMPASF